MLTGDYNVCINGKMPPDSPTCAECGLSRRNYKPQTNFDRLIRKTPEEMAVFLDHIIHDWGSGETIIEGKPPVYIESWLDWLLSPAKEGEI